MAARKPLGLRTRLWLAATALMLWGGAMLLFVDMDRLAGHL